MQSNRIQPYAKTLDRPGNAWVSCLRWLPDGRLLVAAGKELEIWDCHESRNDLKKKISNHTILDAQWIPSRNQVAAASYGCIKLVDLTGAETQLEMKGSFLSVTTAFLAKSKLNVIAGGMQDAMVCMWAIDEAGARSAPLKFSGFGEKITGLQVSPDGSKLAAASKCMLFSGHFCGDFSMRSE